MEDFSPPDREYPQIGDTRRHSDAIHSSMRHESSAESIEKVIESSPNIPVFQHTSEESTKSSNRKSLVKRGTRNKSWLGNVFRFKKQKVKTAELQQRMSTLGQVDFGSPSTTKSNVL